MFDLKKVSKITFSLNHENDCNDNLVRLLLKIRPKDYRTIICFVLAFNT